VADKQAADEPADGEAAPRIARFDGLGSASTGPTRVADFDGLDGDGGGGPIAPVIRLDSLGSRRGSATRRSSDDSARPRTPTPAFGDDTSSRAPGSEGGPRGSRAARRPVEVERPEDGATDDGTARRQTTDGVPPDGPLPRGRRKRARVGRLGPDAPDPDLPLADADPVVIAQEICLRLLTDRARTRQELAQALARRGVPDEAAAAVLDRFAEVGLIDDAALAGQWVRSRHTYRGLGRRAIAVELRRKGVADGVAKEALAEVDAESENRRARELVDRKLRSVAVGTPDQRATAARRLVGMLARKGYSAGTAYRVVRAALAEHGADADELGPGADLDG
jgi:regulatory protein